MADKVKVRYSGDEGGVNPELVPHLGTSTLKHGEYNVDRDFALRLLQTAGWSEVNESELTEEARKAGQSPEFSHQEGGEISASNPGSVEYWRLKAEEEGTEYPPPEPKSLEELYAEEASSGENAGDSEGSDATPGPSDENRPTPGSTEQRGGSVFARRRSNENESEEGGSS